MDMLSILLWLLLLGVIICVAVFLFQVLLTMALAAFSGLVVGIGWLAKQVMKPFKA